MTAGGGGREAGFLATAPEWHRLLLTPGSGARAQPSAWPLLAQRGRVGPVLQVGLQRDGRSGDGTACMWSHWGPCLSWALIYTGRVCVYACVHACVRVAGPSGRLCSLPPFLWFPRPRLVLCPDSLSITPRPSPSSPSVSSCNYS